MTATVVVSPPTLDALATVISGGSFANKGAAGPYGPYRSGPEILEFFRPFGYDEEYGPGFGSRLPHTKDKLLALNGAPRMKQVLEASVDPRHFIELDDVSDENAASFLKDYVVVDPLLGR